MLGIYFWIKEGNNKIIMCERGIRTFETATRNTLDLAGVSLLKTLTHLPVVVDPSHATGIAKLVNGKPIDEVISLLEGTICRGGTSCPDQLARALKQYKETH